MEILGIAIEGESVKGAIVNTQIGEISSKQRTIDSIDDTRPHKLISKMHKIVKKFNWDGPIGVALPATTRKGRILSTQVLDQAWVDADADHLFSEITGCDVQVINASDAAGLAEVTWGIGKKISGTVIMLTISEVIGSSVFANGTLVPNTQLGNIEIKGKSAQERASNKARKEDGLQRKAWAKTIEHVLENYEKLFHPEHFIIGGQLSNKADKTLPYIKLSTKIKAAEFKNDASLVGAAYFMKKRLAQRSEKD